MGFWTDLGDRRMGQIILEENIAIPQKVNNELIALPPSIINIEGQQYRTKKSIYCNAEGLLANSLYHLESLTNSENKIELIPSRVQFAQGEKIYEQLGYVSSTTIGTALQCQGSSFTPIENMNIGEVGMEMWRDSGATGTFYFELYATAAGIPTGAPLGVTTAIDFSEVPEGAGLQELILGELLNSVSLVSGTMYALVVKRTTGTGNLHTMFNTSDVYAGGTRVTSSDGGSSWAAQANDHVFHVKQIVQSLEIPENFFIGRFNTDNNGNVDVVALTEYDDTPIGTKIAAMLTERQFQALNGSEYILMDDRDVTGTKFHEMTGLTTMIDHRGQATRGKNNGRVDGKENADGDVALGTQQTDDNISHRHTHYDIYNADGVFGGTHVSSESETGDGGPVYELGRTSFAAGGNEARMKSTTKNIFMKVN